MPDKGQDEARLETRVKGTLMLIACIPFYLLLDGYVFTGTNIDVRWLLIAFVPISLAMIMFPHVSWLQK